LWESNTWITDAHWIYPGDVLLVEGEAAAAQTAEAATNEPALGSSGTEADDTPETPIARLTSESRPVPLGTEAEIYCYGYIGHPDEPMPNYVESHEDVEVMYLPRVSHDPTSAAVVATGDLVYIRGNASTGLVAGETYMAVEPAEIVRNPNTGVVVGRNYAYTGQIRILCIEGDRARAVITQACREIRIGTRLKPMPQLPIPIARVPNMPEWCDAPTGRTIGTIVDSRDWDLELAEGVLVQVDLGAENQLQPGDFLTVYRASPRADQPRMVLGEIGVLTTQARTATGIIVAMRRTMQIGDSVEMR
jgi:hypothetical protein